VIPSMPGEEECSLGECSRRKMLAAAMTCEALEYMWWARRRNWSQLREVMRKDVVKLIAEALH
jgi:hypothetical protein